MVLADAPLVQNTTALIGNETFKLETNETLSIANATRLVDSAQQEQVMTRQPLPQTHINSSWIGNLSIPPPGYRLYSTREMQL